jgi:uncharacterized protein YaaN involved in tellurite resistance
MSEKNSPVTAAPAADPVAGAPPSEADREAVTALARSVDVEDAQSIIHFGTAAQRHLSEISDEMLDGVRNKDTGAAGDALNRLVGTVRGFDVGDLDPARKPGLMARLLGKGKPVARLVQRYEEVRTQIDLISDELERHKTQLLTDVVTLDRLYATTLDYFRELERYIAAGEHKLRELDEVTLPARQREAEASGALLDAQRLRDLRAGRDALERRVHDLRLTRQVVMQALPSIRLVQENDKGLVNKIVSTTANTLPLWRQQLAQAVTIHRSREAAGSIRAASDLTNELLEANARNLRQGNAEARAEIERGVFDIEAVERANTALVETIQDSLRIADEGRQRRAEASVKLLALEGELRRALQAASAPARAHADPA